MLFSNASFHFSKISKMEDNLKDYNILHTITIKGKNGSEEQASCFHK